MKIHGWGRFPRARRPGGRYGRSARPEAPWWTSCGHFGRSREKVLTRLGVERLADLFRGQVRHAAPLHILPAHVTAFLERARQI